MNKIIVIWFTIIYNIRFLNNARYMYHLTALVNWLTHNLCEVLFLDKTILGFGTDFSHVFTSPVF